MSWVLLVMAALIAYGVAILLLAFSIRQDRARLSGLAAERVPVQPRRDDAKRRDPGL